MDCHVCQNPTIRIICVKCANQAIFARKVKQAELIASIDILRAQITVQTFPREFSLVKRLERLVLRKKIELEELSTKLKHRKKAEFKPIIPIPIKSRFEIPKELYSEQVRLTKEYIQLFKLHESQIFNISIPDDLSKLQILPAEQFDICFGHVVHLIDLVASILDIELPFPVQFNGSSSIVDGKIIQLTDEIPWTLISKLEFNIDYIRQDFSRAKFFDKLRNLHTFPKSE